MSFLIKASLRWHHVLICISLVISDVEHLSTCLLALWMSSSSHLSLLIFKGDYGDSSSHHRFPKLESLVWGLSPLLLKTHPLTSDTPPICELLHHGWGSWPACLSDLPSCLHVALSLYLSLQHFRSVSLPVMHSDVCGIFCWDSDLFIEGSEFSVYLLCHLDPIPKIINFEVYASWHFKM